MFSWCFSGKCFAVSKTNIKFEFLIENYVGRLIWRFVNHAFCVNEPFSGRKLICKISSFFASLSHFSSTRERNTRDRGCYQDSPWHVLSIHTIRLILFAHIRRRSQFEFFMVFHGVCDPIYIFRSTASWSMIPAEKDSPFCLDTQGIFFFLFW